MINDQSHFVKLALQKDEDYVNHLGLPQLHGTCPMTVVVMPCLIIDKRGGEGLETPCIYMCTCNHRCVSL